MQIVRGYNGSLKNTFPDGKVPQEFFVWAVHSDATAGTSSRISTSSNARSWNIGSGDACYIIPEACEDLTIEQEGEALLLVISNRLYEPSPNKE